MTPIRHALVAALIAAPTAGHAAQPTQAELVRMVERLAKRVESLEHRNAELESRLAGTPAPADTGLTARVEALESANERLAGEGGHGGSLLDGIEVEGNVVGVLQGASGSGNDEVVTNWRGDVGIALPAGTIGRSTGSFYVQLRAGQAEGPSALPPTFTGTVNTASFQQVDTPSSNANAIVAQAFYQLDTPLGAEGTESKSHLQLTVGKQDPFVFFDQNAVADNEVEKFMNNVFVHNPMLDSGGAIGADDYGFTPGVRVAYTNEHDAASPWGVSAAVYGTQDGATFGRSFTTPLYIGQVDLGSRAGGKEGTYRLYAWHNGRYEGFDGSKDKNVGFGISIDQQITESLTLFGRYGHTLSGKVSFDRALTLGGELAGTGWGREDDGLGFAWGWLRSARDFRRAAVADYGHEARGAEQVAELYYRYAVNEQLALSPDLQLIHRPGADPDADSIYTFGVRALYGF
ncbi:carbohydrate porin [Nitrogeniibacter mangrovi]|uniref:Carbohydrate porin n=1 Tax=Nitrogeniibacter mangrovi TaxID=2016596 RepID=A0A6C1B6B8_9RHOO|nr:carbohydrate porin [Nitrogeniibacter mangrovi]QID18258.1 carbohydrate porin [Nitrogeniibacter mangrovi]